MVRVLTYLCSSAWTNSCGQSTSIRGQRTADFPMRTPNYSEHARKGENQYYRIISSFANGIVLEFPPHHRTIVGLWRHLSLEHTTREHPGIIEILEAIIRSPNTFSDNTHRFVFSLLGNISHHADADLADRAIRALREVWNGHILKPPTTLREYVAQRELARALIEVEGPKLEFMQKTCRILSKDNIELELAYLSEYGWTMDIVSFLLSNEIQAPSYPGGENLIQFHCRMHDVIINDCKHQRFR